MRFRQFSEGAMDDTIRIMQKTFSPERRAVQDKVLEVVRMVQMGKGDKMELARAITELAKSELEVKRSDPDLKISVDQNLGMLDRAMKAVTGMSEGITEDEIEEYKSLASLRNRSSLDAMARLQDRNKKKEPKVIEIPKGTQLDLFKKAAGESVEEGVAEADKAVKAWAEKYNKHMGVNQDQLAHGYLQTHLNTGVESDSYNDDEYYAYNKKYNHESDLDWEEEDHERFFKESPITSAMHDEIDAIMQKYSIDEEDVNRIINYLDIKEGRMGFKDLEQFGAEMASKIDMEARRRGSAEESLTEEQFDEKAGEKDACYRKVKSRYKVWPSAYASGALVQCRKVGAANWGNKSKKKK